jgi:hypothetical protein
MFCFRGKLCNDLHDFFYSSFVNILSACLVTTAWHVLGFGMEETASRYGRQLRIY